MPNIANLTHAQLRGATKAQIITGISNYLTNNMTKRQIIHFLMDADVISDEPVTTRRPDGQIETFIEVERDMETNARTGGRVITYSYYPTGEVDTIIISNRNAADVETSRQTIKHFTDGRQPEVTK